MVSSLHFPLWDFFFFIMEPFVTILQVDQIVFTGSQIVSIHRMNNLITGLQSKSVSDLLKCDNRFNLI